MRVIDFETEAIVENPTVRPPKPVGVAVKKPGFKSKYLSWGHPSGNNCTFEDAQAHLQEIANSGEEVLFHNAKFDLSVAEVHMGVVFDATKVHDTLFLIFLHDPYASTMSLKPSSERILGIAPDEQTDLHNWIMAHVPEATEKTWGAHIACAPVELVAPYARGDVDRTLKLFNYLHPLVPRAAYDRERALLPLLMESERRGVRMDQARLEKDMGLLELSLEKCDMQIYRLLKNSNVNLDSGVELADAIESAGLAGEWVLTPTGKRSTARDNLLTAVSHPELRGLLVYRGALAHLLSNFGRPWVALTRQYGGRLHPDWSQVRQARGDSDDTKGTRTGRVGCIKPNFTNVSNEYDIEIPTGLFPLPLMRQYLLPDKGMVWCKRDYSQQELRIMAHFSEGRLFSRYIENPRLDAHEETASLIKEFTGLELGRKPVKITGFSIIYGAGLPKLAQQLGVPYPQAQEIRNAYFAALPEVQKLMKECSRSGQRGEPITTWGGRIYHKEPSKLIKGRMVDFSYKLLNYLIQGSGADCTKEALVRWGSDRGGGQFLAQVYDEVDIQAPIEDRHRDMGYLRRAMESIEFDIPMLSDGFYGENWANLVACE